MSTIQTYFLTLQITENIKKWSKLVSKGVPKIHQKSSKIHPGTFQGSFERTCVPLDHQNGAKLIPRTSKLNQNCDPRTLKGDKINNIQWQIVLQKSVYFKQCSIDFNPGNPSNPANQLFTGYQRGRRQGRSLKIRRTSSEVAGRAGYWIQYYA